MNKAAQRSRPGILFLMMAMLTLCAQARAQQEPVAQQGAAPTLGKVTLEHPNPAFPYYHFRAELEIDQPALMEASATVNGKKLRFVSIKDAAREVKLNRPLIHDRPAFANTYVDNNYRFSKPYIIGRLPWQPGQEYKIALSVRAKQQLKAGENDLVADLESILTAPADAKVFASDWKSYKGLVLSETAGIDRKGEPVDIVLAFYADEAKNLAKDLRVVAIDPQTNQIAEVPSQAYDIKHDVVEGDPQDPKFSAYARSTFDVKIWVPTITARVAFLADVPANTSKVFLVYHNNPDAKAPNYESPLTIKGPAPGLTFDGKTKQVREIPIVVESDKLKVTLHPHSGVLYEMTLKSKPDHMLYHKMETNGSIHWAPEAYPPPRPWTHTSDWMQPKFESWQGPVVVTTLAHAPLPHIPEVDAAVSYKFYPHLPYIISTTSMRVNEPIAVQALRNGEMVFKRGLLTHLAYWDPIEEKIQTVSLKEEDIADLDQYLFEHDVPWMSFFNPETGIGIGGVQMEFSLAGLEHLPRIVNPYYYVIVGPVIYWSRAMNFTFAAAANQLMIEAPKGTALWEKWGYVLYNVQSGDNPHAELLSWQKKLSNPLRVRLVEEVTDRVPTVGTEIYIDPSKTGWEERETAK